MIACDDARGGGVLLRGCVVLQWESVLIGYTLVCKRQGGHLGADG